MSKSLYYIYRCYLGKHLLYRTATIIEFIKEQEGIEFFNKYSTELDSVLDFVEKCAEKGLM